MIGGEMIKKMWIGIIEELRKQMDDANSVLTDDQSKDILMEFDAIERELKNDNPDYKMIELRGNVLAYLGEKL
jgi:hypothetical protein